MSRMAQMVKIYQADMAFLVVDVFDGMAYLAIIKNRNGDHDALYVVERHRATKLGAVLTDQEFRTIELFPEPV